VARRAGGLQISRYQNPGAVREKAPKDFVTEVDLLCEELMVNAIRERYPDDAILSEERGGSVSEDGRTWLLDPVDGTANSRAAPLPTPPSPRPASATSITRGPGEALTGRPVARRPPCASATRRGWNTLSPAPISLCTAAGLKIPG
jgi:hypothetical protein